MASAVRTDSSFKSQADEDRHCGTSVLLRLPIDAVKDIPFDYMHLVSLGVVRKSTNLWLSGPFSACIGPTSRKEVSEKIVQASKYVPAEFVRKGREIAEFDRWKATKLRLFLLYTGTVLRENELHLHFINFQFHLGAV